MNTQHSVWITVQVSPCEAGRMSKSILFWRTAFLIRDISEFSKDRLCWLSLKVCLVNLVSTSMCPIMSARQEECLPGGNKNGDQMIISVKDRTHPSGLEERRIGGCFHHNADSPLCPGKAQRMTPNHPGGSHPKNCTIQPLASISCYPMNMQAV